VNLRRPIRSALISLALLAWWPVSAAWGSIRDYRRRCDAGEDLTPAQAAMELGGLLLFVALFVALVAFLGFLALTTHFR